MKEWELGPEEHEWTDKETGYVCWIRRHPRLRTYAGYVGVPTTHPLDGRHYLISDMSNIEVHGGITFSGRTEDKESDLYWFGFDCAHYNDYIPYSEEVRQLFGNGLDGLLNRRPTEEQPYRNFEFVKNECEKLADQLKSLENTNV